MSASTAAAAPVVERVRGALPGDVAAALAAPDDAMIYGSPDFHAFLADAAGGRFLAFVARRGGAVAGALCAFEKTVAGAGTVFNSLPWYGSHGGCIGDGLDDAVRTALLRAVREHVATTRPLSATVICTPEESAHAVTYRRVLEPRAEDQRIGQFTQLPDAGSGFEQALEAVLRQKTRNLVRKARRQGFVEVVSDAPEAWRALHAIHVRNMAAIGGTAKPWSHFVALQRHIPPSARRLSLARSGDAVAAALLVLAHRRTVEYLVPVIDVAYRPRQPLSFLIWQAMTWAAQAGHTRWNWGGTWGAQDSLHHFKAGWGAADRPYRYFTLADDAGVAWIRAHRDALLEIFPFYFVYPFGAL